MKRLMLSLSLALAGGLSVADANPACAPLVRGLETMIATPFYVLTGRSDDGAGPMNFIIATPAVLIVFPCETKACLIQNRLRLDDALRERVRQARKAEECVLLRNEGPGASLVRLFALYGENHPDRMWIRKNDDRIAFAIDQGMTVRVHYPW